MSKSGNSTKNKFNVEVVVVPFKLGEEPSMGVVTDEEGKYLFPNENLKSGGACFTVADSIINSCCVINRNLPYSVSLHTCLTSKDTIFLVFSFTANQKQDFFNEEISFISASDAAEAYRDNRFVYEYGEIAKAAIIENE